LIHEQSTLTSEAATEKVVAETTSIPGQLEDSHLIPVIILNWNGEGDTIECLLSIKASAPARFLPVLVDNGSTPESLARLKRECAVLFPNITFLTRTDLFGSDEPALAGLLSQPEDDSLVFIENGENLGFAKGNNVGIRLAELIGAEWVMLLNNDTVVSPDLFAVLRNFLLQHLGIPAITPEVRRYGSADQIQNCGGELTYFGSRRYRFANRNAGRLPKAEFSRISFVTGCALLLHYKVTGPLSEDFFFGEEDYELSLRMQKRGLPMACVYGAVVHHKLGASIRKSAKLLGSVILQYVNRLIDTRNYYSRPRWEATRLLGYLYLPFLLAKSGINPAKSLTAIRIIQSYIRNARTVDRTVFELLVNGDW